MVNEIQYFELDLGEPLYDANEVAVLELDAGFEIFQVLKELPLELDLFYYAEVLFLYTFVAELMFADQLDLLILEILKFDIHI